MSSPICPFFFFFLNLHLIRHGITLLHKFLKHISHRYLTLEVFHHHLLSLVQQLAYSKTLQSKFYGFMKGVTKATLESKEP